MLNELSFYEIDIDYLGDESGDEGGGTNEDQVLNDKEKLLKMA